MELRTLLGVARRSPFHRDRWGMVAGEAAQDPSLSLSDIPMMTKRNLAEQLDEIVIRENTRGATRKTTGGSTGQPVTLLKNPGALARERAATFRAYEWAGVEPGAPQARFWGVPHVRSRRMFYVLADVVANRRRFSAFGFNEQTLERYFRELCAFRPKYLYGYVSMLQQFARYVRETGKRLPDTVVSVITTSEVLSEGIRADLKSAFNVPVFNEYGCGEVGSIAHECERGRLHVMAENLILEIVDEHGKPAQQGELVVTDLHNIATPLIRYRLGDFATSLSTPCECGRGLPCLERVHGRAYDIVQTPEGLRIHPEAVIYVFEMMKEQGAPIQQFQVEQIAQDRLVVRVVPDAAFGPAHEQLVTTMLHGHVSRSFKVDIQKVNDIAREPSGKLRLVKSSLGSR